MGNYGGRDIHELSEPEIFRAYIDHQLGGPLYDASCITHDATHRFTASAIDALFELRTQNEEQEKAQQARFAQGRKRAREERREEAKKVKESCRQLADFRWNTPLCRHFDYDHMARFLKEHHNIPRSVRVIRDHIAGLRPVTSAVAQEVHKTLATRRTKI
jgi:predicted TIM-barrel fold metal-dependent hydrolase